MTKSNAFFDERIERIKEHLSPRFNQDDILFAAVIGSYAEQLQTPSSDVDIIAVFEHEGADFFETTVFQEKEIDVWFCSIESYINLLALADRDSYFNLAPRQLELIHKATHGYAIFGHEEYAKHTAKWNQEGFQKKLIDYYIQLARSAFDSLHGVILKGDWLASVDFGRQLIRLLIDAMLAHSGDTYPKRKWRFARCSRVDSHYSKLTSEYFILELNGPTPESWGEWVNRCLTLTVNIQLEIYGNLLPTEQILEPADKPGHLTRTNALLLARNGDLYVLFTFAGAFKTSLAGALKLLALPTNGLSTVPSQLLPIESAEMIDQRGMSSLERKLLSLGVLGHISCDASKLLI
nr:nucleotidyltransferase domain-containing protein [uncultured Roseateles sp.]